MFAETSWSCGFPENHPESRSGLKLWHWGYHIYQKINIREDSELFGFLSGQLGCRESSTLREWTAALGSSPDLSCKSFGSNLGCTRSCLGKNMYRDWHGSLDWLFLVDSLTIQFGGLPNGLILVPHGKDWPSSSQCAWEQARLARVSTTSASQSRSVRIQGHSRPSPADLGGIWLKVSAGTQTFMVSKGSHTLSWEHAITRFSNPIPVDMTCGTEMYMRVAC